RSRKDVIQESNIIKNIFVETLVGKLRTHELELQLEPVKSKSVAFKASAADDASSVEDSNDLNTRMRYVPYNAPKSVSFDRNHGDKGKGQVLVKASVDWTNVLSSGQSYSDKSGICFTGVDSTAGNSNTIFVNSSHSVEVTTSYVQKNSAMGVGVGCQKFRPFPKPNIFYYMCGSAGHVASTF
ncbi:hypothetical protein FRX31_029801, partial [Thalictrum thalictroides]